MGTTFGDEFLRGDGANLFNSAAIGGLGIEGGDPARRKSLAKAAKLDRNFHAIWSQHPSFHVVCHTLSF